jgi:hypothetical protein
MTYDKAAATVFLEDLDDTAKGWTFQTFNDNADRKAGSLANTLTGTLDARWETLCSLSQDGAGVFVTVNETDGKARKAENITRRRALFVDTEGANDNQIDRARTVWEPRIGPILTDDDARQIAVNVTGFFSILAEWARLETPTPANDTGKPSPSVDEEARHDR